MRAEGIGMDFSREKALAYAHRWAFGRNPEYLAFDRLGGDCTSFVSQCLLAGGAPEDPTPLWGWYYRSGNDKARLPGAASSRSGAFSRAPTAKTACAA